LRPVVFFGGPTAALWLAALLIPSQLPVGKDAFDYLTKRKQAAGLVYVPEFPNGDITMLKTTY
jgi:hypothetical protein